MPRTPRNAETKPTPFLEVRIGGLHLILQHVPYRLLALATAVLGSIGGATWLGR